MQRTLIEPLRRDEYDELMRAFVRSLPYRGPYPQLLARIRKLRGERRLTLLRIIMPRDGGELMPMARCK